MSKVKNPELFNKNEKQEFLDKTTLKKIDFDFLL